MKYYVYTNWTQKHARVHKGTCKDCNNGQGKNHTSSTKHGMWLKPFKTYEEARKAAKDFIDKRKCKDKIIACGHCHPELA